MGYGSKATRQPLWHTDVNMPERATGWTPWTAASRWDIKSVSRWLRYARDSSNVTLHNSR